MAWYLIKQRDGFTFAFRFHFYEYEAFKDRVIMFWRYSSNGK